MCSLEAPPGVEVNRNAGAGSTDIEKTSGTRGTHGTTNEDAGSGVPVDEKQHGTKGTKFKVKTNRSDDRYGVYYHADDDDEEGVWISTPIKVIAVTHNSDGRDFGRLLEIHNTLGHVFRWSMPMRMLSGTGESLRSELLDMGVRLTTDFKKRQLLLNHLQSTPTRVQECTDKTGWSSENFVLPDQTFGKKEIVFQSDNQYCSHTTSGDLENWKSSIAALAVDNRLLTVAISAAFAGPLLHLYNIDNGGIHLTGDSSKGKTTLLRAAASVWGSPDYRRNWRATGNGIEAAATELNDGILCLDEIAQCEPREVGQVIYALGNGYGKQRANRTGSARQLKRWRCLLLSSGENTIESTLTEGGKKYQAGQSVRLLDVPATNGEYGAFENLHQFERGSEFADSIKQACESDYGHAGREFLKKLTGGKHKINPEAYNDLKKEICSNGNAQELRAANTIAIIATAGELATTYGLTNWKCGAATAAAKYVFSLWRAQRGDGEHETSRLIDSIREFIEKYSSTRFKSLDGEEYNLGYEGIVGYRRRSADGVEYLLTSGGFKEVTSCTGKTDVSNALSKLEQSGILIPYSKKERRHSIRANGAPVKVYLLKYSALVPDVPD